MNPKFHSFTDREWLTSSVLGSGPGRIDWRSDDIRVVDLREEASLGRLHGVAFWQEQLNIVNATSGPHQSKLNSIEWKPIGEH